MDARAGARRRVHVRGARSVGRGVRLAGVHDARGRRRSHGVRAGARDVAPSSPLDVARGDLSEVEGQGCPWVVLRIASMPPMYGRSGAGIVTDPSLCWKFSRIAMRVRPTARPEPFSACANSALPDPAAPARNLMF